MEQSSAFRGAKFLIGIPHAHHSLFYRHTPVGLGHDRLLATVEIKLSHSIEQREGRAF